MQKKLLFPDIQTNEVQDIYVRVLPEHTSGKILEEQGVTNTTLLTKIRQVCSDVCDIKRGKAHFIKSTC